MIAPTNFRKLTFCLTLLILFSSCKKWVQGPPPDTLITDEKVFADDNTAQDAVIGMYTQAMNTSLSYANGGISLYAGLSADELTASTVIGNEDAFTRNAIGSTNPIIADLYGAAYNIILNANTVIQGVAGSKGMTAAKKAQFTGEAKFMRALVYFYQVNLWGPVPLITQTDPEITSLQPRAAVDIVYDTIISDLVDAKSLLPSAYPTKAGYEQDRTRPNSSAAAALLSRVYLFRGRWAEAENEANFVIQDSRYKLEPLLDSVFLEHSHEAIFQLQPVYSNQATAEGYIFNPYVGNRPSYPLRPELMAAWEVGDQRKIQWTQGVTAFGTDYVFPCKYKQRTYTPLSPEYNMVIRLAETYLIRAEAKAQQGNLSGGVADLNVVRHRAGLPTTTAITASTLLTAIYHERQVELFTEWGHRWLDLKRTNRADSILGAEKPGWTSTAALFPIPQYDIETNPNLTQNPGY